VRHTRPAPACPVTAAPGSVAAVADPSKLLDGDGLGPLAVRRFDRAEIFAATAHDDDAPASQVGGLFGIGTPGHADKIVAAEREGESARHVVFMGRADQFKVGAAC
jgi:hypothetical protein